MKALVINNDLLKSANLNDLKDTTEQWLSHAKPPIKSTAAFERKDNDFIFTFQIETDVQTHQLVIRDIGIKGYRENEMVQHLFQTLSEIEADLIYLHMTSFGPANRFKDYITVRAVNRLAEEKLITADHVTFFTSGPADVARFQEETCYRLIQQNCVDDVLRSLFEDMGLSEFLKS